MVYASPRRRQNDIYKGCTYLSRQRLHSLVRFEDGEELGSASHVLATHRSLFYGASGLLRKRDVLAGCSSRIPCTLRHSHMAGLPS